MPKIRDYLYLFLILFTYHNTLSGQLPPDRGEDCGEEYNQCYVDCVDECVHAFSMRDLDISLDFGLMIAAGCEDNEFNPEESYTGHIEGYWVAGCHDSPAFNFLQSMNTANVNQYFHCVEFFCGNLCYQRDIYIYSCPD